MRTILHYVLFCIALLQFSCEENIHPTSQNQRANDFLGKGLYDSAIYYANQSLLNNQSREDVYYSHYLIAYSYNAQRKYLKATDHYLQAFTSIPEDGEYDVDRFRILSNMAVICKKYGDYNHAKDYYRNSLQFVTNTDKSSVVYNLANVYRKQKDYEQASEKYLEALDLALTANDVKMQIRIYHQLGGIYAALKDFDKSRTYYNHVISYANDSKVSRLFEGKSLHNIGDTYMQTESYEEAISYFQKALAFKNSARQKFVTLKDLGSCYYQLHNYDEAIRYLSEAKSYYPEVDQRPANIEVFKILEETYRITQNNEGRNNSIDAFYAETSAYNEKRDLIVSQYSAAQLDMRIANFYESNFYLNIISEYQLAILVVSTATIVLIVLLVLLRKREIRRKKYIVAEIANEMLMAIEKDS